MPCYAIGPYDTVMLSMGGIVKNAVIKGARRYFLLLAAIALILTVSIVFFLVTTYSAPNGLEAENGTITGADATTVADASASSGNAVKFDNATVCETVGDGGYQLPDLAGRANSCNTGPRHTCTSTHTGNFTTSYDGQVVENLCIDGSLRINHNNVTVRDVKITTGALYLLDIGRDVQICPVGIVIEYTEIDNSATGDMDWGVYQRCAPATGVHTFSYVKIHNIARGFLMQGNIVVYNSYIYSQYTSEGAHRTAISSHGGDNFYVYDNTFICVNAGCSSSVNMYSDYAPITNYRLENNVLAGGSICLRAGSSHTYGDQTSNIKIFNNRFSTVYYPECGIHQAFSFFDSSGPGNERSGNVWHETGTPVTGE